MENSTPISQPPQAQPGQTPKGYFDFAKKSLKNIWKYKFLWFWGIFLPTGGSFNFNFGNSFEENNPEFQDFQSFAENNWQWFLTGAILIILMAFVFWIISAIARRGVIQGLDKIQNKKENPDLNFKKVWQLGKKKITTILGLDLVIGFSMLIILAVLILPIVLTAMSKNFILMALLIGLAILIFLPLVLFVIFAQNISVILISLIDEKIFKAIKKSLVIIRANMKEALKLVLVFIIIGMLVSIIIISVLFAILIFLAILGTIMKLIGADTHVILITLIPIGVLIMIAVLIFVKLFTSLWKMDIWIWWTKKINGLKVVEENQEAEEFPAEIIQESQVPALESKL